MEVPVEAVCWVEQGARGLMQVHEVQSEQLVEWVGAVAELSFPEISCQIVYCGR